MVRFLCVWTVHDTPRRNSRSLQRCRPGRAPHPPVQRGPQATSARPDRSTFPCSCLRRCPSRRSSPPTAPAATHSNPTKPHLRRHDFRSNSETKPIKDPASVCGLVHCTVSSVTLSAERCLGGPSRSYHGEGNRQHPATGWDAGPPRGVWAVARWERTARNRRDPPRQPSGKDRGYKAGRLKSHGAGRESEGFIVPGRRARQRAGGKGPALIVLVRR
jgi:hypothetical protein